MCVWVEGIVGKVLAAQGATARVGGKVLESRVSDWSVLRVVESKARFRAMLVLPATTKPNQEPRSDNDGEGSQ